MLDFDLGQHPPTRQEIEAEQQRLNKQKKKLLQFGLISDGLHALVLFSFYFVDILSGSGFVLTVLVGTVIALVLATGTREKLAGTDKLSLSIIMVCGGCAVGGIAFGYFDETLSGAIIAGAATGSIIATGRLLGRRIMQVLSALESLGSIGEEHPLHRDLLLMCHQYPELERYRQQARDILRPFLTFGEMKAMQAWIRGKEAGS